MSSSGDSVASGSDKSTLEDFLESLKNLKEEKEREIFKLMGVVKNNEVKTIGPDVTPEEIRFKRLRYIQSMAEVVAEEQPQYIAMPNTHDAYADALNDLEEEVQSTLQLEKSVDEDIAELEASILALEHKKVAFQQMDEACQATSTPVETNLEAELVTAKCIFQEAKKDLATLVEVLYPNNENFQTLLYELTRAYTKGGDNLYITRKPEHADFVAFLDEADITQYHPHDKTKVKLRDL
ncbi:hypothetical protein QAD02_023781 [Eretmocerus hayati]|uniref:Uncharacterized protein n=1 Tax=Eretmocerus hayati TaxID=131215 RepID=A0ACC2PYZ8_9HYME|nr:hypothetical protein QAD02_023781 [Eretmocerus hayati]